MKVLIQRPSHAAFTLMASLADVIAAAQREEDRLREEREAFDAAAAAKEAELAEREAAIETRMPSLTRTNNRLQSIVKLNVGGTVFTTSMTSLQATPDNLLLTTARRRTGWRSGRRLDGAYFFQLSLVHRS